MTSKRTLSDQIYIYIILHSNQFVLRKLLDRVKKIGKRPIPNSEKYQNIEKVRTPLAIEWNEIFLSTTNRQESSRYIHSNFDYIQNFILRLITDKSRDLLIDVALVTLKY